MENEIMIGNTVDREVHLQPPYEPPLSFYFSLSDPIRVSPLLLGTCFLFSVVLPYPRLVLMTWVFCHFRS